MANDNVGSTNNGHNGRGGGLCTLILIEFDSIHM